MKILIVDDEEMIRAVLREYIEFEGGEADEACDGMEAVKLCRNDISGVLSWIRERQGSCISECIGDTEITEAIDTILIGKECIDLVVSYE